MIVETLFVYIFDRKFLLQTIATLTTYLTLRVASSLVTRNRRFKLFEHYGIPGPKPSIISGSPDYYQGKLQLETYEAASKKYGKVFGFFMGDQPVLVTTDLELLRRVFLVDMKSFKLRMIPVIENSITDGILFAPFNRWKLMRKVMSPSFSQYTIRGEASTQFVETSIKLMLGYIDKRILEAKSSGKEAVIDIHNLMKSTALHLISSMAVDLPGVTVQEDEENVKSLEGYLSLTDQGLVDLAIKFPIIKPLLQFLEKRFVHGNILGLIHSRLNKNIDETVARLSKNPNGSPDDNPTGHVNITNALIKLYHKGVLTRDEVIGNAEALLFAGYDTTSTTAAYILWVIAKYPDVQEKLREELMAHGVDSKYLMQVLNEAMRLYPTTIWFATRHATEDLEINGWNIPSGMRVDYNAWLINRNPEIWPEPLKFDPERFRDGVTIHPCAFAPFGLGEHKCIGYQLAILELKMVTCDLLLRYRLKLKSPENLELVSYAFWMSKPKEKIRIEMQRLDE